MNDERFKNLKREDFALAQSGVEIHDEKLGTKSLTYFQDAMVRFRKNKASVIGTYVILVVLIYAIIAPFLSPFTVSDTDGNYSRVRPKIKAFERSGFWDGSRKQLMNNRYFYYTLGIGIAAEDKEGKGLTDPELGYKSPFTPVNVAKKLTAAELAEEADSGSVDGEVLAEAKKEAEKEAKASSASQETKASEKKESDAKRASQNTTGFSFNWNKPKSGDKKKAKPVVKKEAPNQYYSTRIDSYYMVGFRYVNVSQEEYDKIRAWEQEHNTQVIYPQVNNSVKFFNADSKNDANYWYLHDRRGNPVDEDGQPLSVEELEQGKLVPTYLKNAQGEVQFFRPRSRSMKEIRVLYYNYYLYKNGHGPEHIIGADGVGYDIWVRMASGVRLSILLAIFVSVINFVLGALYGALEGYYGGWVDLLLERISDILSGIPFIVVTTLFQLHLVQKGKVTVFTGLLFAFCLTGWIGTAYRVRTQFYRFKKEEYVLAARTMGARDTRLMFKHIFPNAIGTIITSAALTIPGVIMSESSLSYLGIVNFNSSTMTSLGTILANGKLYMVTDPHILFWPSLVISLMMIAFNLFGNGLRDAFNPSLRGADE